MATKVFQATDVVYDRGVAITPQFAIISASVSGNTELVAAVSGKRIRVVNYSFMAAGTVNVKFQSGTDDITGLSYLIASTGKAPAFNAYGHFQTGVGKALNINLSGNIGVGGELQYILVDA